MGFFNYAFEGGRVPPRDIGRPQGEFVRLAQAGEIAGTILDVGCDAGENALYLASLGHKVCGGVECSPLAIEKAKRKTVERDLEATFLVWDALELYPLGRKFDTVIDSGLCHVFSDQEQGVRPQSSRCSSWGRH